MKTLLLAVMALVAFAPLGFAGTPAPVLADVELQEDPFSNISVYAGGVYQDGNYGGLTGVQYDFDLLSVAVEYAWTDVEGSGDGLHQGNLIFRKELYLDGINPYVLAGPGFARFDGNSYATILGGVGLELELSDGIAAFIEYRYSWAFDETDAQMAVLGLSVKF